MIILPALLLGCLGQAEFENLYDGLILADTSPETALAFCRGFYDESKIA